MHEVMAEDPDASALVTAPEVASVGLAAGSPGTTTRTRPHDEVDRAAIAEVRGRLPDPWRGGRPGRWWRCAAGWTARADRPAGVGPESGRIGAG